MITPRVNIPRTVRKRYYLAFEGARTEPRYFSILERNRIYDRGVRTIRLKRGPEESHDSNPSKLVNLLIDYVDFIHNRRYPTRLFINNVLDYLLQNNIIYEKDIKGYYSGLKTRLIEENLATEDRILNAEQAEAVAADYFSCILRIPVPLELGCYHDSFYCEDSEEEFCLIVDRDERSFSENQVESVSDICVQNRFRLIISNPCFELWLLLHFDVSKEVILSKCNQIGGLKEELRKYSKINEGPVQGDEFKDNVDKARQKLKGYAQDIDILKRPTSSGPDCIGSNIGYLIDDLMRGR